MNTKTIEQKAKAYDEALERAKQAIIDCGDNNWRKNMVRHIFPELAESNDERIRKMLYGLVCAQPKSFFDGGYTKEDVLALLEKQKHVDYPYAHGWRENRADNKPKIKHSVLMLTKHGVAEGEWLGDKEWFQYKWFCTLKDSDVLCWRHLSDLENVEENELMKARIIKDLEYLTEYEPQYKERQDEEIDWLKSLRPQFQ